MHALTNEAIVGIPVADERRRLSVLAALGVWLGVSAVGWAAVAAVAAVVSSLA